MTQFIWQAIKAVWPSRPFHHSTLILACLIVRLNEDHYFSAKMTLLKTRYRTESQDMHSWSLWLIRLTSRKSRNNSKRYERSASFVWSRGQTILSGQSDQRQSLHSGISAWEPSSDFAKRLPYDHVWKTLQVVTTVWADVWAKECCSKPKEFVVNSFVQWNEGAIMDELY